MGNTGPINKRKDDRYPVQEIFVDGLGTIIEASRRGLKIKTESPFTPQGSTLSFTVESLAIVTEIKWQEGTFLGLEIIRPLSDPAFFIKKTRKAKETIAPPQMKINPDTLVEPNNKGGMLPSLIDLLLEVEGEEPDLRRIAARIDMLCPDEEEEPKPKEEEEVLELKDVPLTCKQELIIHAQNLKSRGTAEVKDVHFAISILGVDLVRDQILAHIRHNMLQFGPPLSGFENYEKLLVLKSVFFYELCRFFGLSEIQAEGAAILSSETAGFDSLIQESSGILDQFYRTPSRLYSEVSRAYEKAFFGTDPLQINLNIIKKSSQRLADLYNGYVLAHCTLSPHYNPPEGMNLSLSKNNLIFSYLSYLTFLALRFLLDKDRGSGYALIMKLKGKGMDLRQADAFINNCLLKTETLLKDLGLPGRVSLPSLPDSYLNTERLLGKDVRFEYLRRCFTDFGRQGLKRMALRYDDESYAHYILSHLLNAESHYLSSKSICIVPCRNISADPWYLKDFDSFDLLVFKDFPKLSPIHLDVFLRLWETFEGQIIATFSYLNFLDFTKQPLYKLIKDQIVDFPSGLINENIYNKMVDHTIDYLSPYLPEKKAEGKQFLSDLSEMNQKVDRQRFLSQVLTMNHIKTDILLTEEVI
jgi:hypothetical protein